MNSSLPYLEEFGEKARKQRNNNTNMVPRDDKRGRADNFQQEIFYGDRTILHTFSSSFNGAILSEIRHIICNILMKYNYIERHTLINFGDYCPRSAKRGSVKS